MKIKLYNDVVFKWVFGRQAHTGPLISLLNAATDSPGKFSEVEILNPFDPSEPFKDQKQGILDIRAMESKSREWVDLEVQVVVGAFYPQRSKFYLAGMYRDQLEKGQDVGYDALRSCHGIHFLLGTLFDEPEEKNFWYNHYAMLNTRSHRPLINHWHLYFIELKKFLRCFAKKAHPGPENELEEWSLLLGTIQDNTKPLNPMLRHNHAIQEVYEMIQTFTEDDRLREQYRLVEEFLRTRKTDLAAMEKLRREKARLVRSNKAAIKAKEKEKAEKEAAIKAREKEKAEKEAAIKAQEEMIKISVLFMKTRGIPASEIAQTLGMSEEEVERL